jgi:hypothetical protein
VCFERRLSLARPGVSGDSIVIALGSPLYNLCLHRPHLMGPQSEHCTCILNSGWGLQGPEVSKDASFTTSV